MRERFIYVENPRTKLGQIYFILPLWFKNICPGFGGRLTGNPAKP